MNFSDLNLLLLYKFCLHLPDYHDSLIHLRTIWYYFRPRGVAVVASRHLALVWEVFLNRLRGPPNLKACAI